MILEAIVLFNGLAFVLLALGYWIKSKAVMFGGSAILLIVSAAMMLPDVFGGGIEYKAGSTQTIYQNATNVSISETITDSTITETATYSMVNTTASALVGLALLLLSLYVDYAVWFDEDLE